MLQFLDIYWWIDGWLLNTANNTDTAVFEFEYGYLMLKLNLDLVDYNNKHQ